MEWDERRKPGRKKKQPDSEPVIRQALRDNLDKIVGAFVKQAMEGSCPHFKLVCQLLEKSEGAAKKDPVRALLDKWRKEQKKKAFEAAKVRGEDGRFVSPPAKADASVATEEARESLEG